MAKTLGEMESYIMGKTYFFMSTDKAKALAMGNTFMARCRAIGKKCRPFPVRKVLTGKFEYTVDVCGPADARVDRFAEEQGE